MNQEASAIVIELAKEFIALVQSLDPTWSKGYFRFKSDETHSGSNASYVCASGVLLISAMRQGGFYRSMNQRAANLFRALEKKTGLFLLTIDDSFEYDIKFEWDDLRKWEITMLDGRTGIPVGL